jgi:hypothetical protein
MKLLDALIGPRMHFQRAKLVGDIVRPILPGVNV